MLLASFTRKYLFASQPSVSGTASYGAYGYVCLRLSLPVARAYLLGLIAVTLATAYVQPIQAQTTYTFTNGDNNGLYADGNNWNPPGGPGMPMWASFRPIKLS